MNNINDDIRTLLSKFDSKEKLTLKESDNTDNIDDMSDIQPSEDDGFIKDLTRGGYGASVDGKFIGNFDDRDDAEEAIRDAAGPNFSPNIWFIDDHGGVELVTDDELSEVKKLAGIQEETDEESEKQSIPDWLVKQYEERAENERRGGGMIDIDYRIPTVAVELSDGSEYFFQEHEAQNLIDEVPENISTEDFILASAQSW